MLPLLLSEQAVKHTVELPVILYAMVLMWRYFDDS